MATGRYSTFRGSGFFAYRGNMSNGENINITTRLLGSQEVSRGLNKIEKDLEGVASGATSANAAESKLGETFVETSGAIDKNTASLQKNTAAKKANTDITEQEVAAFFQAEKGALAEADGVDILTGSLDANTGATDANTAAQDAHIASMEAAEAIQKRYSIALMATGVQLDAAEKAFGPFYNRLHKISQLGTPELLKASTYAALGTGGVIYEGIKKYMEFNREMTQSATMAGVSISRLPALSQGLLNISRKTGIAAGDLATQFYRVASGTASWHHELGASNTELLNIATSVAKLNVIGNVPHGAAQEQTARVVLAMVNSQLKDIGTDPMKAVALTTAIQAAGDIRTADLISALGRGALVNAALNKMSGADLGSWLDLLTLHGTSGAVAGTYVKSGMNMLFNPTAQGAKGYAMIGINQQMLQNAQKHGGIVEVAKMLNEHLNIFQPFKTFPKFKGKGGDAGAVNTLLAWTANQLDPALLAKWRTGKLSADDKYTIESMLFTKMFGGSRGFSTIAALEAYLPQLESMHNFITTHATVSNFNKSYQNTMKTPGAQWNVIKANVSADLIEIGKQLTPTFLTIARGFAKLFHAMKQFKPILYEVVGAIAALLGYAVVTKGAKLLLGVAKMRGGFQDFLARHGATKFEDSYARRLYQAESKTWQAKYGDMALKTGVAGLGPLGEAGAEQLQAAGMQMEAARMMMGAATGGAYVPGPGGAYGPSATTVPMKGRKGKPGKFMPWRAVSKAEDAAFLASTGISKKDWLFQKSLMHGGRLPSFVDIHKMQTEMNAAHAMAIAENELRTKGPLGQYGPFSPAEKRLLAILDKKGKINIVDVAKATGKISPTSPATSFELWNAYTKAGQKDLKATKSRVEEIHAQRGGGYGLWKTERLATEAGAVPAISRAAGFGRGLAAVGTGALNFLGGPWGMLAMTALPIAMPFIAKGLSALGGLFGGGPKPPPPKPQHTKTLTELQVEIAKAKAKLAKDQKKLVAGNTSEALLRDIQRQTNIIKSASDKNYAKKVARTFAMRYSGLAAMYNEFEGKLPKGMTDLRYTKSWKLLTEGQRRRYFYLAGHRGYDVANQWIRHSYYDAKASLKDPVLMKALGTLPAAMRSTFFAQMSGIGSSNLIGASRSLLNSQNLYNKKYAQGNFEAAALLEGRLALQYKKDQQALDKGGLSDKAKAAYKLDQQKIADEVRELRKAQQLIAAKNHITTADAKAIGSAMAAANREVFASLGLSQDGFTRAMSTAISQNGGLGSAVLGALYNAFTHGSPA